MINTRNSFRCRRRGFTLLELLVVIAIVILLLTVMLPSLKKVRDQARIVVCTSNLRSTGTAIQAYAHDFNDAIPLGPEGLPPPNFYAVMGNVTSLISLSNRKPVGLGLLLSSYLSDQPEVLFCPGTDQPTDAKTQLERVGRYEAQSDYHYRHGSIIQLTGTPELEHTRLSNLGRNRSNHPITALVMDIQFLAHPSLMPFGVFTRTAHRRQRVNILMADGRVHSENNADQQLTIDIGAQPNDALDKILQNFERADELR